MDELGVIHGRFQGLHLGHMEYLLAGAARCRHLLVGITNFEPDQAPEALTAAHRGRMDNPFTYYERMAMVRDSLMDAGLERGRFDIIPFPIEAPERIANFAPPEGVYYMTIYDGWGRYKHEVLRKLGLRVEVLWVRDDSQRLTSGTEIRARIARGEPWRTLVPPAVYRYITGHGLDRRLREAAAGTEEGRL